MSEPIDDARLRAVECRRGALAAMGFAALIPTCALYFRK